VAAVGLERGALCAELVRNGHRACIEVAVLGVPCVLRDWAKACLGRGSGEGGVAGGAEEAAPDAQGTRPGRQVLVNPCFFFEGGHLR
jgi:hypothetical protein